MDTLKADLAERASQYKHMEVAAAKSGYSHHPKISPRAMRTPAPADTSSARRIDLVDASDVHKRLYDLRNKPPAEPDPAVMEECTFQPALCTRDRAKRDCRTSD